MTGAERASNADEFISESPGDTRRLANDLLRRFPDCSVFALHGNLGSGKTCLVQGMALALDIREPVSSPTFSLVNEYVGSRTLIHMDLYRLDGTESVLDLGWDEIVEAGGVVAVEWAERAAGLFPPGTVHISLHMEDQPNRRRLRVWRNDREP